MNLKWKRSSYNNAKNMREQISLLSTWKGTWRGYISFPLKCCYFLNSNQYQNFFPSPRLKCTQPFYLKRLCSSVYMVSWKIHDHYTPLTHIISNLYLRKVSEWSSGTKIKNTLRIYKSLSYIHYVHGGYKITLRSNTSKKKCMMSLTSLILEA